YWDGFRVGHASILDVDALPHGHDTGLGATEHHQAGVWPHGGLEAEVVAARVRAMKSNLALAPTDKCEAAPRAAIGRQRVWADLLEGRFPAGFRVREVARPLVVVASRARALTVFEVVRIDDRRGVVAHPDIRRIIRVGPLPDHLRVRWQGAVGNID